MIVEEQKELLLLSSNVRRRYAEDILTALALPAGAMIQFRYGDEYVASAIDRDVAAGTLGAAEAVLAFVADAESDDVFIVPVRYATVVSARRVANILIFQLRVGDYVDLHRYPASADDIRRFSKEVITGLVAANKKYQPAVYSFPDLRIKKSSDAAEDWQRTAARLARHDTFSGAYFLRVDPPRRQNGSGLSFDGRGRLEVTDQESMHVSVSFYSEKYDPDRKRMLTCTTDGTFLRVSSDAEYEVALRYDTVEFWVHPAAHNYGTLSRLTVGLTGTADDTDLVPAYVRFPVAVRRSRSRLLTRILVTTCGALLVALPAILGAGSPLQVRVASALVGASLLSAASIALGAGR